MGSRGNGIPWRLTHAGKPKNFPLSLFPAILSVHLIFLLFRERELLP